MRTSIAAIGLIQREIAGQRFWLAQWNDRWRAYSFVGGHKHDNESFRECMVREVIEELGLLPDEQFIVSREPMARLQYASWSESAHTDTLYTIELFDVQLSCSARSRVDAQAKNRWLTEIEIDAQATHDGKRVSHTTSRLLNSVATLRSGNEESRESDETNTH